MIVSPYPGESCPIFDGWSSLTGYGLNVVYRQGSSTLAAGDEWRLWVDSGLDYLGDLTDCDGDPVWVVVLAAGSGSVTVTASEGRDPSYGDTSAAHPTALGTFTLTEGDNVIPTTWTVEDARDNLSESMMLVLDATAGSASVEQVKMRVWPAAGAVGGWSDVKPAFTSSTSEAGLRRAAFIYDGGGASVDPEASWDAAVADLTSDVAAVSASQTRTLLTGTPAFGVSYERGMAYDGTEYATTLRVAGNLALLSGVDPSGRTPIDLTQYVEGVDWVRPPDEVRGDRLHYADIDGDPYTEWVTAEVSITSVGSLGSPTMRAEAGGWSNTPTLALTNSPAVGAGVFSLPTTAQQILVELSHTTATGDIGAWPGWAPPLASGGISDDGGAIYSFDASSRVAFSPYRLWNPNAAADVAPKVRQIHRDDGRGMTPPRHFGGASRANTGRHFGYD